jgi:DNA-3-methyladenine glycosylase II
MITHTVLPTRAPFDFGLTLAFLRGFSPMMGEQRVSRDALSKSWIVGGEPAHVTLRARGDALACTVETRASVAQVLSRVSSFVSAEENLDAFYAIAARDRAFAPVARRLRGLHHPKFATPFEAACWSVINQRVARPQARAMKAKLVARFGAPGCDAFPEAFTVARATEKEIGEVIGRRDRKARAVWSVAQAFARVDEKWLQNAPIADVTAWLRAIYGVGEFASGFIAFRGLGRMISLLWAEPFVLAARKTYPGATRATLERRAAAYGDFAGHWSLYLWASTFV